MSDTVQVKATFTGITIKSKTVMQLELNAASEKDLPKLTGLVNNSVMVTLEPDQMSLLDDDETEDTEDAEPIEGQTVVMDFIKDDEEETGDDDEEEAGDPDLSDEDTSDKAVA